mgnify:FL=1
MYDHHLYERYGKKAEEWLRIGPYDGFESDGEYFVFVPFHETEERWKEKWQWAYYLEQQGERALAQAVPTVSGDMMTAFAEEFYLLFRLPLIQKERDWNDEELGALALFHEKGRAISETVLDTYFSERWCHWWDVRLQQLEEWYKRVRKKRTQSSLDKFFMETFPYYVGRTENAIQWFKRKASSADWVHGVIAHHTFTPSTWLAVSEHCEYVKLPTDWLYDHPTRDIAEWLRHEENIKKMFDNLSLYEHIYPLTERSRHFLFGRLLFPYEYIHTIEETYQQEAMEDREGLEVKLQELWKKEPATLEKLAHFLRAYMPNEEDVPTWLFRPSM